MTEIVDALAQCNFASMNETTPTQVSRFIWVSRLEAVSFLVLVGIAMPLKYAADMPLMVKYVGWAHGVLFIAYMLQLGLVAYQLKWDILRVIAGFVAALLPFGPFIFERRVFRTPG